MCVALSKAIKKITDIDNFEEEVLQNENVVWIIEFYSGVCVCVVCVCVCVNCSLDHRVLLRCEYICVMYCILEEKGFSSKQVCVCVCVCV